MGARLQSMEDLANEIASLHKCLPPRPDVDKVKSAKGLIESVDEEEKTQHDSIDGLTKAPEVSEELSDIFKAMQKHWVSFKGNEMKREALTVLDIENVHNLFDDLALRASNCISASTSSDPHQTDGSTASTYVASTLCSGAFASSSAVSTSTSSHRLGKEPLKAAERLTRDDSYLNTGKALFSGGGIGVGGSTASLLLDSSSKPPTSASGQDGEQLSLMKLMYLIEISSKNGTQSLDLRGKLEKIDWLPESIGKLSSLITLDLSDNQKLSLPLTIGGLSSLIRLDLRSNGISELPYSIGDLLKLVYLDLSVNELTSLPPTISKLVHLEELNLSSNQLPFVPSSIGSLVSLRILNVNYNGIEEITNTINQCTSLRELRADFNRLSVLPEAVGKIESLEILSARSNAISRLPTTMASLSNLRELNLNFNELESVPEDLCLVGTLVNLNLGNNFVKLQFLPEDIGNLGALEELDIRNNQIKELPNSFALLRQLRVLHVEGNPLNFPPPDVVAGGAQAAVAFMAAHVERRMDVVTKPLSHRLRKSVTRLFKKKPHNRW